jgi:hypothetical protein
MSYYSMTLDRQIYSENIGYFTTINIYSDNINKALNEAIKIIRKNVFYTHNLYTNDFTMTDIEILDFGTKQSEYYFYNLYNSPSLRHVS